jgi:hypothetical protein
LRDTAVASKNGSDPDPAPNVLPFMHAPWNMPPCPLRCPCFATGECACLFAAQITINPVASWKELRFARKPLNRT